MTKKRAAAGEVMARLEEDPEYQARRRAQETALAELGAACAADEHLLVAEIREAGYDVDSVWDLVNSAPHPVLVRRFIGPYPHAYPILVRHLQVRHHPRIREGVIRALTVRDGGEMVWQALLQEFDREMSAEHRWLLANALKYAMPYSRRRRRPDIADAYRGSSGA
jgi:hypothetical protein